MNIAVFFDLPNAFDYPLSKQEYYQAYLELSQAVEAEGASFFIVRGQPSYLGNGEFQTSWRFEDQQLQATGRVHIDVIFDKGRFISDGKVRVLNYPAVTKLCTDKWVMYQQFPQFCPLTQLAQSTEEVVTAISQMPSPKVVIKPVDGYEGRDVMIVEKHSVLPENLRFPVLVQEFLDSSQGIPGIVEGIHDFRIALINDEIVYAFVRTPAKGSLIANVAQGGTYRPVDLEQIPEYFLMIVREVDWHLKKYIPRHYCIDLCLSSVGPKIIEMNSKPGLSPVSDGEIFAHFNQRMAAALIGFPKLPTEE